MRLFYIVISSLALSLGSAVGMHCQSLSLARELTNKSKFKQPLWVIGTLILIMDAVGDFIFIGFVPQSILAPLGALSLCWNTILSPCFRDAERTSPIAIFAVILIYGGTLFTISFAGNASPDYSLEDIDGFFRQDSFRIYATCCAIFLLLIALHGYYCNKNRGYGMYHSCGMAGCLGAQSLLFAKITSELVRHAVIDGKAEYWKTSLLPYLFVLTFVVLLMIQSKLLEWGMVGEDPLVMIPIYQSVWNIFGSIGGFLFFQEFQFMNLPLDVIMYTLGFIITLLGIAVLVKQQVFHNQHGTSGIRVDLDELEMASLHDDSIISCGGGISITTSESQFSASVPDDPDEPPSLPASRGVTV